jgi:hypothetical protein
MTDDTYRWFLPKGVKIAKSAADRVELWVLGIDSRSSLGDAGPTDTPVVEEAVMIWERGDWRISDDRPPLRPSPVKPTARRMSEAGWLRLAFTPTD